MSSVKNGGSYVGVIFSTEKMLDFLAKSDKISMDGTFYVCPRLFYQVYTIFFKYGGKFFPGAVCLLDGIAILVVILLKIIHFFNHNLFDFIMPLKNNGSSD